MKFKALGVLSMAALLCACSSGSKFESVDIVYLNPNHDKVMSEVLQSKPIAKTEAQKVFSDPNTTIEVYYDDPVNDEYRIQVVNLSDISLVMWISLNVKRVSMLRHCLQ